MTYQFSLNLSNHLNSTHQILWHSGFISLHFAALLVLHPSTVPLIPPGTRWPPWGKLVQLLTYICSRKKKKNMSCTNQKIENHSRKCVYLYYLCVFVVFWKACQSQGRVSSIKQSGILVDKGMQMQAHCMPCCMLRWLAPCLAFRTS